MVEAGHALPGDADLIILPGSKSTRGDLAFLREQGWDIDLKAHLRRGGKILGLCGGYQMLGKTIDDPEGIEGPAGKDDGLGLLNVDTLMTPKKRLVFTEGWHIATGEAISGYEIHIGETTGPDCARPLLDIKGRPEGAISTNGQVMAAYVHGLFSADGFRAAFLKTLGGSGATYAYETGVDETLDALADHLGEQLDLDAMLEIARGAP